MIYCRLFTKIFFQKERRKAEQLGRVNGSEFDNSRLNSLETAAMVKHDKTDDEKLRFPQKVNKINKVLNEDFLRSLEKKEILLIAIIILCIECVGCFLN